MQSTLHFYSLWLSRKDGTFCDIFETRLRKCVFESSPRFKSKLSVAWVKIGCWMKKILFFSSFVHFQTFFKHRIHEAWFQKLVTSDFRIVFKASLPIFRSATIYSWSVIIICKFSHENISDRFPDRTWNIFPDKFSVSPLFSDTNSVTRNCYRIQIREHFHYKIIVSRRDSVSEFGNSTIS